MRYINRVQLFGNLTRDPDLTYTKNNTALAKVGMAVNRSYKDKNDEWQEIATFLNITFWGKMAERVAQMRKGEKVYIDGRLETNSWTDDAGKNHSRTEVVGTGFIPWSTVSSQDDEEDFDIPDDFDEDDNDESSKDEDTTKKKGKDEDDEKMPF